MLKGLSILKHLFFLNYGHHVIREIIVVLKVVTFDSESPKEDRKSFTITSFWGSSDSRISCFSEEDVSWPVPARIVRLSMSFSPAIRTRQYLRSFRLYVAISTSFEIIPWFRRQS